MTLRGVRFAVIEELPEAGRLNTQRLKKIVGTGAITARKMKQDFVTFEPQHALFVTTNHLPIISETDHGTWRRLDRVPFKRRYRPAGVKDGSPMDQALHQRVLVDKRAWKAALATLVEYAGRWYANNKLIGKPPESVRQAVDEWRGRSDDLRAGFEERMEADPGSYVLGSEYLADFNDRLAREGGNRQEWSPKLFAQRLQGHEGLPARNGEGEEAAR